MTVDYKKTYELLRRINAIEVGGKSISSFFTYRGYDLWGAYQSSLFCDLKSWSGVPGQIEKYAFFRKSILFVKHVCVDLSLIIITKISFLISIVTLPKVLIFTGDKVGSQTFINDQRIDSLYAFLKNKQVHFLELIHTVPRKKTLQNVLIRKRFVLFYESFFFSLWKDKAVFLSDKTLESFSEDERNFTRYLVQKYTDRFSASKRAIFLLTLVLKITKPKAVWGIDDTRYSGELVIACRQAKIPLYLFQHGHFTKYHVGWLAYGKEAGTIPSAKYLVVWNSYWKKELLRLGTYYKEDELIVGGEKQLFKSPNPSFLEADFTQKKAILIPYETDAPKDEVKVFIDRFKKSGFEVYLKVRSDISKEVQCQEYGFSPGEVHVITDYNPIISEVALIVGVYSTFLYDLIGAGVPVAIFETSMDYGYGMVENGLAGILYKDGLIQDQVTRICREYPVRNSLIGKIFSEKKLLIETIETISKQCNITLKK